MAKCVKINSFSTSVATGRTVRAERGSGEAGNLSLHLGNLRRKTEPSGDIFGTASSALTCNYVSDRHRPSTPNCNQWRVTLRQTSVSHIQSRHIFFTQRHLGKVERAVRKRHVGGATLSTNETLAHADELAETTWSSKLFSVASAASGSLFCSGQAWHS